jgi:Nucleotidyltransferase
MRKAGITAQKMRHLELLLVSPWSVRVGPRRGMRIAADVELFVANPTSFIIQKPLINADRPLHKKAQDFLHIHDTLELFGASLVELRRLWVESVRPRMAAKTAREPRRSPRSYLPR